MKYYIKIAALLSFFILSFNLSSAQDQKTGFLLIAPDRGFMGNQEVRDLFTEFNTDYKSSLVFITEKDTDRFLIEGINKLQNQSIEHIVVLPMFISDDQKLYKHAKERLGSLKSGFATIEYSDTMHESYLIAEILLDRIQEVSKVQHNESLILVASDTEAAAIESVEADLNNLLSLIEGRTHFKSQQVIALKERNGRGQDVQNRLENVLNNVAEEGLNPVVVIADMSQKLDGMMAFNSALKPLMKKYNAAYNANDFTPHHLVELWLRKKANEYTQITSENLGVVFMPHGADYNWNRTMMDAIADLHDKYMIDYAFSMGDAELTRRAVERLEKRGAKAITVLRIFSLEDSFKSGIEYAIGLKDNMGHHGMMHGMGMPGRVLSSNRFYTTGGLEDSPYFAEALLDRAIHLSDNPEDETVILVGHGTRTEKGNQRWLSNLESISNQMESLAKSKGLNFKDFKFENWREDWPDLREERIQNVRDMVTEASEKNGTAIVIPARTTKGGHAQKWLAGLDFKHDGEGFAPHPLFTAWVESLIQESLDHFNADISSRELSNLKD